MRGHFRLPMFAVALALLALIVAARGVPVQVGLTHQRRRNAMGNCGQCAEQTARDRICQRLRRRAHARVSCLFQNRSAGDGQLSRAACRCATTAGNRPLRYPRLIKQVYVAGPEIGESLQWFNSETRTFSKPVAWPDALAPNTLADQGAREMQSGRRGRF
jgi:hypothetical protein